jgi:hypothetical protein
MKVWLMRSIIQKDLTYCAECLSESEPLQTHHCIFGRGRRKPADKHGLTVKLCNECHVRLHANKELADKYRRFAQMAFEEKHGREEFMKIFGRNYLGSETD